MSYRVLFWILLVLILCSLIGMSILGLTVKKDAKRVFNNNLVCLSDTDPKCQIKVNPSSQVPAKILPTYQKEVAKFCLDLVSRVAILYAKYYDKDKDVLPQGIDSCQNLTDDSDKDPVVGKMWIEDDKRLWISFRGTQTTKEMKEDVNYRQVKMGDVPGVMVHGGFLDAYNRISKQIHTQMEKSTFQDVIITGHSLGSALAVLCGYDLQKKYNGSITSYIFACPRVGNSAFRDDYNVRTFSTMNIADIVPNLPLSVMPAKHNKVEMFEHVGEVFTFQDNWKSLENNHSLALYTEYFSS